MAVEDIFASSLHSYSLHVCSKCTSFYVFVISVIKIDILVSFAYARGLPALVAHACLLMEARGLPALVAHACLLLVSSISTWHVCVVYDFYGCMHLSYTIALKVNLGSRFSKFIVLLLQ
jgi:hypothetical protein